MSAHPKKIAIAVSISIVIASFASFAVLHIPKPLSPACSVPGRTSVISHFRQNQTTTLDALLQLIKRMTVELNFTSTLGGPPVSSSQRVSYVETKASMDDGRVAYKLNLSGTTISGSESETESATVWVDPATSNILLVSEDGQNFTGAEAQKESWMLEFFTQDHMLSILNSSTVFSSSSNRTADLNSTELFETTYSGLCPLSEYQNLVIVVGSIPHSSLQLVLSSNYVVAGNGYGSFRVLDLSLKG